MPFDKLYVMIKCTVCDGTKFHSGSGHHNPYNIFEWKECPYCSPDGEYLIEAHANSIAEYFRQLSDSKRKELINKLLAIADQE